MPRARPAAPADAMQSLVAAAFIERTPEGARFAFDSGWECRICILADDLFRVLFVPRDGLRERRTWMVAPGGIDVPWEGRTRLDVSAFERPPFDLEAGEQTTVLQTTALRAEVRLRPFGVDWSIPGKAPFAADRPTRARFCSDAHRAAARRERLDHEATARDARIRILVTLHTATLQEGLALADLDAVRPELDRIADELDALVGAKN